MSSEVVGEQGKGGGTAGVMARPPVLFLAGILLGLVSDRLLRLGFPFPRNDAVHWIIGGLLMLGGLVVAGGGIRDFKRAKTPVPTNEPTRALVTTGMHGWTRNPIYVGMFLLYVGIGIVARSWWVLILTVPLAVVMRYGVVAREEAYLERRFGGVYREYKARVRRWV
jgi:protein-S-isoprenylcysteine O-methyltransferase Ste14